MITTKFPVFSRGLAGLFAGLAALCVFSGYLFYGREAKDIRAQKYAELSAIAELKAGQIAGWSRERVADARVSASGNIRKLFLDWRRAPADKNAKKLLAERLEEFRREYGYQNMMIAAPDGRVLFSLVPRLAHLDGEAWRTSSLALSSRTAVFGDFFRCPVCRGVHLDTAVPLRGQDGRPAAVLILRSDPETFLYPLIQSWPLPSRSGETMLVRRDGDSALFLNKLLHNPAPALTLRIPLTRADAPAVKAALGGTGLVEGTDYRGRKVLADIRGIPGTPWYMIAKVDSKEILAELHYRETVISAFVLLAILLAAGGGVLLNFLRQKKLYLDLDRTERERFEAKDEIRATLYGIGDGVIAVDTDSRVTRLNPAAEQLTGWPEKEAVGRPLEEVFRIISEETREPAANPAERVLKEGVVAGLSNHTLLLSRDGKERSIADSGAPIRDKDGKIRGMVLVFRDQGAERKAEKALEASELRHRAIFETSRDIIILVEPQPERQAVIRDMNPAGLKAFGYSREEVVGKSAEMLDGKGGESRSVMERFRASHPVDGINFELQHKRKDGTLFTTEASVREMVVGGRRLGVSVERDITEKKRIQEALRDSEAKYRSLVETTGTGYLILDTEGRVIDANAEYVRISGHAGLRDILGRSVMEWTAPYAKEKNAEALARCVRDGYIRNLVVDYADAAGLITPVELNATVERNGEDVRLIAVCRDITVRRKAETALRESEAKYRELVENINDLVFTLDAKGVMTYVSPQVYQLTGYRPEELVGSPFAKVIFPDDLPALQRSFSEAAAGRPNPAEFRWVTKAGTVRWGRTSARRLLENGELKGVNGLFSDITERKRTELAQTRLATLVQDSMDAIIGTDPAGMIQSWSPGAKKLFGYAEEEVLGKHISLLAPPQKPGVIKENIGRVLGGEAFQYQDERRAKDGSKVMVWAAISPIKDAAGVIVGVSGIYRDITERSKVEAEIREAYEMQSTLNAMLQLSLQNVPLADKLGGHLADILGSPWLSVEAKGAVFTVDPRGRELVMAASRGLAPELLEKCARVPFGRCLCGRAAATATLAAAGDLCAAHEITYQGMQPHGHYCAPINAEGKVLGVLNLYLKAGTELTANQVRFVKAAADVMAENILHSQVEDKFSQAQKMEAVGLLAGGVAHDFNNILTAIKCYTEFVQKGFEPGDPKREDTQEILNSVERAISLTRQLLAFSRRQILAPQVVDVNKTLGSMANMLRRIIGENIILKTSLFNSPCLVKADPGQLEQVILNLAVNARDAMPGGGTLTLETEIFRPEEEFFFTLSELPIGPLVCLRVSDTGTGMTPEVKSRLFEPFFTTKEQGKGTGLGLPMVFGIVKQSNGEIEVQSEPGKGTAFIIYLPFAEKPPKFSDMVEKEKEKAPEAPSHVHGHETVLLVEDEDTLRRLAERVLRSNGYTVLAAADGPAALKLMEERGSPVDLLMTDVVMPGMSGRDLARELDRRKLIGRTLYMSGYTDEAIVRHGVLEPGIAFMYKPFTLDGLTLKIREVLDGPAEKAKA